MRGVSLDGTTIFKLQRLLISPPPFPEKPMVLHPNAFAYFIANSMFLEFPEVDMPMSKSPLFAKAST